MKHVKLFEEFLFEKERDEMTELENHVIDHFRNLSEPFEYEDTPSDMHILGEFAEGYARKEGGKHVYDMGDPGDAELLDKFVKIVKADEEGSYNYNSDDFKNVIVKSIEKFGL